ncbi:MAG: tetraacyldisaccharide 4'-kinase [Elusimicrobiales bacterium]
MELEKIRNRIKKNVVGRLLLSLLSIIYYTLFVSNKLIRKKIIGSKKIKTPIICVGNISVGGSGKTTVVSNIAAELSKKGFKIAVVMRGYKSQFRKNDVVESDYENLTSFINDPMVSDEQKVLSLIFKDQRIPVIASKNRFAACMRAVEKYNPDFIIFDDGFQNFSFEYFFSVVVINPNQIDDKLLPFGNLREPYSGVKRADAIIINHCELFEEKIIELTEKKLSLYAKKERIIRGFYEIEGFEDPIVSKTFSKKFFANTPVAVFSGIGDNKQFIEYIRKTHANPIKIWEYPDHYSYTERDLISIEELRERLPLITTVKDAVRILKYVSRIFKRDFYITIIKMKTEKDITKLILNKR